MRWSAGHAALAGMLLAGAVATPFAVAGDGEVVDVEGANEVRINRSFTSTLRFGDKRADVAHGGTVTWRNDVDESAAGEPHTITIAPEDLLPDDLAGVEACSGPGTACEPAFGHVDPNTLEPVPGQERLDVGAPGLDQVGDSLLLGPNPGDTISATVSAPAGTTLHYLCAVHPWMQGAIRVRKG